MSAKEVVAVAARNVSIFANYTEEQISILKTNVAPPQMSDEQLAYCLSVAKARNLDPLKKQVYFALRNKKVRDGNREYFVSAVTVEPTIDGFRSMAESTGELDGYDGPYWCGEDGVWRDVWLDSKKPPVAAKITIFRRGRTHGMTGVARYEAYNQGGPTWAKMGDLMLAKCAESLALRKAFPAELGEFYTHEEMGQMDREVRDQLPPEREREIAPANVVNMPPPRIEQARAIIEQAKPVEQPRRTERPGEGIPERWTPKSPIPASILLAIPPLNHLTMAVTDMNLDELELVVEQVAHAYERWKENPATTQKTLNALNAIGAAASAVHYSKTNPAGAA
jgi:phage recombination protein Bet